MSWLKPRPTNILALPHRLFTPDLNLSLEEQTRALFLWNSRRVLRQVPVELFQDDCDESFEGVRAGGD
jgi:hypothetical protein